MIERQPNQANLHTRTLEAGLKNLKIGKSDIEVSKCLAGTRNWTKLWRVHGLWSVKVDDTPFNGLKAGVSSA